MFVYFLRQGFSVSKVSLTVLELSVDQAGLKLSNLPVSAFGVLGFKKVCHYPLHQSGFFVVVVCFDIVSNIVQAGFILVDLDPHPRLRILGAEFKGECYYCLQSS